MVEATLLSVKKREFISKTLLQIFSCFFSTQFSDKPYSFQNILAFSFELRAMSCELRAASNSIFPIHSLLIFTFLLFTFSPHKSLNGFHF